MQATVLNKKPTKVKKKKRKMKKMIDASEVCVLPGLARMCSE